MTDNTELKRLADELIAANDLFNDSPQDNEFGDAWSLANDRFTEAASPEVILALIAENELLLAELAEMTKFRDNAANHMRRIRSEATSFEKERDLLKAENEALRKDADRYRWLQQWYIEGRKRSEIHPDGHICFTTPAIMDAAIDAAMGKGEQS